MPILGILNSIDRLEFLSSTGHLQQQKESPPPLVFLYTALDGALCSASKAHSHGLSRKTVMGSFHNKFAQHGNFGTLKKTGLYRL